MACDPVRIAPVAPFTGAWIETSVMVIFAILLVVAPFTGAWIETGNPLSLNSRSEGRSLHGSVD